MRSITALAITLACVPVLAQEARGPYVGAGIAQVDYENNFFGRFDVGETDMVPQLAVGFRFNDKLAFETVYTTEADFSQNMSGNVPLFLDSNRDVAGGPYTARYTGSFDSIEVRVLSHAGEKLVLGAGLFWSDFQGRMVGTSPPIDPFDGTFEGRINDSESGFSVLIGLEFDIGRLSIRPEYEYYDLSSPADAQVFSVKLNYGF